MRMKKLFALLFLTVSLLGCIVFAQPAQEVIKVGIDPGNEVIELNPYTASDSNSIIIMQNLYDGLFSYDSSTSEAKEALAQNYEVSSDGLTWTFYLRDAFFSDGKPITAQTFLNSWEYLIQGPLASNLDFVERKSNGSLDIEAPNDKTLIVHLKYPVAYLPSLLCQPCLGAIKDTQSYSGAYVLKAQTQKGIILCKNPKYWDEVKNDKVEIYLGSDFDEAFANGDIQWSMATVQNASEYMILSKLYATTFFYFNDKTEAYSNEYVRKALISLIPWDIIRYIQGTLLESSSLVPGSSVQSPDIKGALDLLSQAGYPYGEGLPMISIAITRGAQNAAVAELIAELWSKTLGVTVTLNTVPLTVYASNPAENPFDFCTITWIGDYFDPMAFLSLFESTSSFNIANYSNEEYDSLLSLAQSADEVTRSSLLLKAEQILLDSGVVIPMSTAFATNFVRTDLIKGWKSNPLDIHPFKDLQLSKEVANE